MVVPEVDLQPGRHRSRFHGENRACYRLVDGAFLRAIQDRLRGGIAGKCQQNQHHEMLGVH